MSTTSSGSSHSFVLPSFKEGNCFDPSDGNSPCGPRCGGPIHSPTRTRPSLTWSPDDTRTSRATRRSRRSMSPRSTSPRPFTSGRSDSSSRSTSLPVETTTSVGRPGTAALKRPSSSGKTQVCSAPPAVPTTSTCSSTPRRPPLPGSSSRPVNSVESGEVAADADSALPVDATVRGGGVQPNKQAPTSRVTAAVRRGITHR